MLFNSPEFLLFFLVVVVGHYALPHRYRWAWLLVKEGYVDPSRFVCPGRRQGGQLNFDALDVARYNDFPERAYVHFSIRIGCPESQQQGLTVRRAIFADLNPIAEKLPTDYASPFSLRMGQDLLTSNSSNHNGRTY